MAFTSLGLVAETINPSFLAVHPNHRFLYAVNEVNNYEDQKTGSISAFSVDASTGRLSLLNKVSSRGAGPCHLTVDKTGKCVLAANYSGGSVAAFPVKPDGSIGEASAFMQHKGSSANQRQQGPHAHEAVLSPDNRYVLVPDLGIDQVLGYRLEAAKAAMTLNDLGSAKVMPASGPRHLAFSPNGRFVYVLNELASTVIAFGWDSKAGRLNELQTVSTLSKDFRGTNYSAEIEAHPNGRFLYASNRGHDSIALFSIDGRTGMLTPVEQVSTQGKTPRNFAIDPTGAYLLAANQDSNNIVLFRIDQQTGRLSPTGSTLEVPSPVCILFVPNR